MSKIKQESKVKEKKHQSVEKDTISWVCIILLATYASMKKGNYRIAFQFYKEGGGINLYQLQSNGKLHRRFAVDYHPFWNKNTKQLEWKLHYHRGKNYQQIKKHRPYNGGW